MTAKAYLNKARLLDKRVDSKLEQIEKLRALAERTTTALSAQPRGTGSENRTEYCVMRIMELEREVNEDIDVLVDLKRDIRDAIERVQDDYFLRACALMDTEEGCE